MSDYFGTKAGKVTPTPDQLPSFGIPPEGAVNFLNGKRISFARETQLWHELSGDILDNLDDPDRIKALIYEMYDKLGIYYGK